jgi:catechol 2,3-dioxygenase
VSALKVTTVTPEPNAAVLPAETRIGRTALRVTDLDEMTAFYRDVVGLGVLERSDTESTLGVEDTPLLVLEGDDNARKRHSSGAGLFHNAFRVPSRAALGDVLDRIRNQWHLDGASDHGVSEALYLRDPEGNGIEIYRDFPREEWSVDDDGRVQLGTFPLDLDPVEAAARGNTGVLPGTDVGHIHLEVSSLDAFRAFYVDLVGFEVQTEGPGAVFVSAGGYHHHIGANTWNHRSEPVGGRGLSWFEIVLPDLATLEVLGERMGQSQYSRTEIGDGIAITGTDAIEVRFRVET